MKIIRMGTKDSLNTWTIDLRRSRRNEPPHCTTNSHPYLTWALTCKKLRLSPRSSISCLNYQQSGLLTLYSLIVSDLMTMQEALIFRFQLNPISLIFVIKNVALFSSKLRAQQLCACFQSFWHSSWNVAWWWLLHDFLPYVLSFAFPCFWISKTTCSLIS